MAPSATLRMWEIYPISTPHVRLRVHGNRPHQIRILWEVGSWAGCVLASIATELDRDRLRNLSGETETEFVRNSKALVDFEVQT